MTVQGQNKNRTFSLCFDFLKVLGLQVSYFYKSYFQYLCFSAGGWGSQMSHTGEVMLNANYVKQNKHTNKDKQGNRLLIDFKDHASVSPSPGSQIRMTFDNIHEP